MDRKKVLITGSSGMLGHAIVEVLAADHNYELFGFVRKLTGANYITEFALDLTNPEALNRQLSMLELDIILHCAANVNLDACEQNEAQAYALHVEASKNLAEFNPQKVKFIYISTDSVFDGLNGDYAVTDIPNPLNVYAKTKWQGEEVVLKVNSGAIILRTNIYGLHLGEQSSLGEWAITNLQQEKQISGFTDVFFNPLYTGQLAQLIKHLIEHKENYQGIIHTGSNTYISKYDFLVKLAQVFGYDSKKINKTSVDMLNFLAKRPKNTTLNIDFLRQNQLGEFTLEAGLLAYKNDYLETRCKNLS
jgi:dTDP-4-dehydrorhamnose reductase